MSLTQEQIEKMSLNLSKISLGTWITDDIEWILKYIDLLNEVDTTWILPTNSVIEKDNILREDEVWMNQIAPMELLNCSNQKVIWKQIAVSNIMK